MPEQGPFAVQDRPLALWRRLLLPIVVPAVVVLDQYTKLVVRRTIPQNAVVSIAPWLDSFLSLTHIDNTGAAFGLLQNTNLLLAIVGAVVVVAILASYRRIILLPWLLQLALALQAGGAAGNLVDRVVRGYVTDFIYLHFWPVFNVADSSVVVGTIVMAFFALFLDRETPEESPTPAPGDAEP